MNKSYKEDELYKYNEVVQSLIIEALMDLSFFEAERRNQKRCEIIKSDPNISACFGWIQQVTFDHLLLSTARLYEEDKDTYNIPRLLQKAITRERELQQRVKLHEHLEKINVKDRLQEYQTDIGLHKYSEIKNKIKVHRDKRLAHNEKNKDASFFNSDYGLSIIDLKNVCETSMEITNFIYECFTGYVPPYYKAQLYLDKFKCFDNLFITVSKCQEKQED